MPDQPYYGDPYNQGDFNWTTKFGKKKKTDGDKLREEGVGEDGGFIDSGELAPDGTVQESRMFDIDPKKHKAQQKQKKIRNIAEQGATQGEQAAGKRKLKDQTQLPNVFQTEEMNKIYEKDRIENLNKDRAIEASGKAWEKGNLTARERIEQLLNAPNAAFKDSQAGAEGYNRQRQLGIDSAAQKVREVTGSKTAGSIVGFLTDVGFPTAEDLALSGVATALATPTGLGAPAVGGVTLAALRMRKFGDEAVDFFTKIPTIISHQRGGRLGLKLADGQFTERSNLSKIFMDDQLARQSAQPMRMTSSGSGPTSSFVKRPNFGSAEEALTAGYGGKSFERLMKSKRHLNKYGDSAEEAAAFMQRGWNHFAVNKTLRGMEGGRYITLSNGQVLKLKTNTAASKINVEKMTGLSLKNDLAQEAYRLKRNLGTQFDIPKLQAFADKSGYPPEAVTAYIKAAKEHNKKIDELVKYLNKKGGSVMWSKGHYRAVENLIQMGTGDKASADMITNVFLQKLKPNARMQAKHDLPHLLNLASNRAASVEEDFLKFVEPELFGSFWPKLTGKYKTVFIDRVLDDMEKAGGKGIDIRDIIEENVNLILEDTNLIETMGRIKFDANKVYPWLQKHGVNIKANFNVK